MREPFANSIDVFVRGRFARFRTQASKYPNGITNSQGKGLDGFHIIFNGITVAHWTNDVAKPAGKGGRDLQEDKKKQPSNQKGKGEVRC